MMKPPLPIFSLNSKIFQAIPPPLKFSSKVFKNSGLGLNQRSVAFWQLPHFREEFIRYLNAKKARTLRQLAARPTEEIRGIFKNVRFILNSQIYSLI